MSDIQAGWVELALKNQDGTESLTLKPTPAAMIAVSRRFGGFTTAIQKIASLDVDAIIDVVIQGAGLTQDKKASERLKHQVFRTGITAVAAKCIEFLGVLQNGGRPLADLEEPEDAAAEGNG